MREPVRWECWVVFDSTKQESAWAWTERCAGWMSTHPLGVMYWLPGAYVYYLRLLDPEAAPWPERDYIG